MYIALICCFSVIPSGDVQSAADPALYYQRWTEDAGAGSGGRQVRHFHLDICSLWIEDPVPPSPTYWLHFPLFLAPAGTSSTSNWLYWVTSGRASCGELSRGGASSTVWFASGSATERWWRSCAGGWLKSPTQPRPCRPGPQCLCSKPAPCSTLCRYLSNKLGGDTSTSNFFHVSKQKYTKLLLILWWIKKGVIIADHNELCIQYY